MGGDLLDELAAFCSAATDPRQQPDPVVLRAIVGALEALRDEALSVGVAEDFPRTMTGDFTECFRRLDAHPVTTRSGRAPTAARLSIRWPTSAGRSSGTSPRAATPGPTHLQVPLM